MDEFLREINVMIFKRWILNQTSEDYHLYLSQNNKNVIIIETNYCHSEITFNPLSIIEFIVTNTVNNEIEFYLHFQMKTMKHAVDLFYEMLDSIKKLVKKPITRILLSCSGGLTTSFFAEKLNMGAKLLYMDYEFAAISYTELFNVGKQYDIIMLAPQISFLQPKVQEILNDKIVLTIPSQVFAKYDAGKIYNIIYNQKKKARAKKVKSPKPLSLKMAIHPNAKILCIAIIRTSDRVELAYRVYDENNNIVLDDVIIKKVIYVDDIYDILNVVTTKFLDISVVGISMPGIINKGNVFLPQEGFENFDLYKNLPKSYHQKIFVDNDVNSIAVGYYASQDKYQSLTYLFQPQGFAGGVGIIFNGQLMKGRKNLAGEVKYLPLSLSDKLELLSQTPEGALELVTKTIVAINCINGPEAFVLTCPLLLNSNEIINELKKYFPACYIPDLEMVKVDDLKEYMLLGHMILCVQSLNEKSE